MTTLNLIVDWVNQMLLKNASIGNSFTLKPFYQGNVLPLQVQICQPDTIGNAGGAIFPDIANLSLTILISATYGGATLAAQTVWTKDPVLKTFVGNLALNTVALNNWMGIQTSQNALMEIKLTEGLATWTIWEGAITVQAPVIVNPVVVPIPGFTPLFIEDAIQRFPQFKMRPGERLTFVSEDGTQCRIEGCNDNGTADTVQAANIP